MRLNFTCCFGLTLALLATITVTTQAAPQRAKEIQLDLQSASWEEALNSLCSAANLTLDAPASIPDTTVTLKSHVKSLDQTISSLNRRLLRTNLLLIVDGDHLVMWDTKTKRPTVFVPRVEAASLGSLGRYQLRTVSLKLEQTDPRQLIEDIEMLMDSQPFGSIVPLRTVNRVEVTALVGTLRRIRDIVEEAEGHSSAEQQTRVKRALPLSPQPTTTVQPTPRFLQRRGTLISYLQRDQVQQMLGLTEEQTSRISDFFQKARPTSSEYREFVMELKDRSREERDALREEFSKESAQLRADADVSAFKVLNSDQQKGFAEWFVRNLGGPALELPLIVNQLELTGDQLKRLRDLVANHAEKLKTATRSERSQIRASHPKQFIGTLNAMQRRTSEKNPQE